MKHPMRTRRTLLAALGAGTLAHTLTRALPALARPADKVWRVGVLAQYSAESSVGQMMQRGLPPALGELGYIEGKNLVIEWRFADLDAARLKAYADDLVRLKADVIIAANTTATHAALKASATLPIVMSNSGDPVGSGFARSLAKPGGSITGLSSLSPEIGAKMFEMLLAFTATATAAPAGGAKPKLTRVAVLTNPDNSSHRLTLDNVQTAAHITGSKIIPVQARDEAGLASAFATLKRERAQALIVARDGVFAQLAQQITGHGAQLRLPVAAANLELAERGALMSFSPKRDNLWQRVAFYVDRIFKGAKPGDLPIEQPTLFELLINGKTAKALGLKIPQSLLISADRVIE